MVFIYCLKCKKKTATLDVVKKRSNNRNRLGGKCKMCGSNKSTFVT